MHKDRAHPCRDKLLPVCAQNTFAFPHADMQMHRYKKIQVFENLNSTVLEGPC